MIHGMLIAAEALAHSPLVWVPLLVALIVNGALVIRLFRAWRPRCQWHRACEYKADFVVTSLSFHPEMDQPVLEALLVCSTHRFDAEVAFPGAIHHVETRILP